MRKQYTRAYNGLTTSRHLNLTEREKIPSMRDELMQLQTSTARSVLGLYTPWRLRGSGFNGASYARRYSSPDTEGTSTFLFIRIQQNPSHYALSGSGFDGMKSCDEWLEHFAEVSRFSHDSILRIDMSRML